MKGFLSVIFATLLSAQAYAASIDPETTEFPWKNGPTRDAVYRMSENANKVHVFEVFANFCSWCHRNAEQVKALAAEYTGDERVQFLDLSLDTSEREIERWIAQHRPEYPVVQDVGRRVWNALKIDSGIPQTFVVNCRGELVAATLGYWGNAEKTRIRQAIEAAKEVTCE